MLSFEETAGKIWGAEGFGRKLLIGGLIAYVPLVNLLWLGYLGMIARRMAAGKGGGLPEWNDIRGIFQATLPLLPVWFVFWMIPSVFALTLGKAMQGLFSLIGLDLLGWSAYLVPLVIMAGILPALLASAILEVQMKGHWNVFSQWDIILQRVLKHRKELLFPTLTFYGLILLGSPILGWALFAGYIPYALFAWMVFRRSADSPQG